MNQHQAKFAVGQLVRHRLFGYRGVVFDVDPEFSGTDTWYDQVARTRPPKDAPWYHVLVDSATHTTYVAERNLQAEDAPRPVDHPLADDLFSGYEGGRYLPRGPAN